MALRSLRSRTAKGRVLSPDPDDPALARSEGEDRSEDHQVHLCTGTAWARASRCRQSVNYQVVAVHRSAEADKLLEELRKKGFPAFILTPAEGAADGWYRVQVGPFHDPPEAQDAKKKLKREGYEVILKKQ